SCVLDRMIFDFHSKMFFASFPGKPFRQRPRFQNSIHLQAEVIVQTARIVFLDDEARSAFDLFWQRFAAGWLGSFPEVALVFVFGESHAAKLNADYPDRTDFKRLTSTSGESCSPQRHG